MPASAAAQSVRPSPPSLEPHANGPSSRFMSHGTQSTHNRLHKSTTSADASDPRYHRVPDMYSKPLPSAPDRDNARLSRSTPMTEAERYKSQQTAKPVEKDYPPTPSSHGHGSSHGHSNTYTASQSSHASSSSIGRHRSATVAGSHGAGLDLSTSSSSSAQGHGRLRRKPVRPVEDTPSEHFKWEPGSEPMVMVSPTDEAMPMTSSSGRRNRSIGVYRDAPGSAALPLNAQATYSRATGASAASSTKTLGQERYILQESAHPNIGRHHHSAHASLPGAGSARTTVQTYFPVPPAPNANQEKLVYKAPSSNGHGSGNASASSNTPTPKAHAFTATTPTAHSHSQSQSKHKSYNLSVSELHTAPANNSAFSVPLTNSSSDERPRRRKTSHRRTPSTSTSGHALSNSTTSASTEDSSHESQEGGHGDGSELWKSGTSLSQMSQGHPSLAQKRGGQVQQQLSHSQQRISPPQQPPSAPYGAGAPASAGATGFRRSRGISDAPAPHSHYSHTTPVVVKLHSNGRSSKDEKHPARPDTATSGSRSGRDDEDEGDRGRGRTKDKDTSFMGRVRARSNSLTKGLSKVIEYPKYLASKVSSKRESKRLGAGGSSGVLAYSEHGHGNASGEAFDGYPYTPSSSTTTTASTAASPTSAGPPPPPAPHHNHSKSSIILPTQHLHVAPYSAGKKREHKRSLSAQPALGHQALSPPPQQPQRTVPSSFAQPRLRKAMTSKERDKRDQNRASPMTIAKNDILQMWEDVEGVDPRRSGVAHAQIQISQSRIGEGVAFPRVERDRGEMREYAPAAAIPFSSERLAPRRR